MLKFDAATAQLLEDAYQGADVSRRRRASFDALAPAPGDRILDLGCGNGLLTLELSRAVGPSGHAAGIDSSSDMLAAAQKRLEGRSNTKLHLGDAAGLPFDSSTFDKAVSVQVFEYLSDRAPALRELSRVLVPGGLLAVADIHFDTLAWHSRNRARMQKMLAIWDRHMAERRVPALLAPEMRAAGFVPQAAIPVALCDTQLRPDGLAAMMIRLIHAYAVGTGAASEDEAEAWVQEQEALAAEGAFFFSLTQFVCTARRA
ncbi:methyltransferase domain-containing protein [Roseobacteraceae bacterium NS-SX3]